MYTAENVFNNISLSFMYFTKHIKDYSLKNIKIILFSTYTYMNLHTEYVSFHMYACKAYKVLVFLFQGNNYF